MLDLEMPPQLADTTQELPFSEGPVLQRFEEMKREDYLKEEARFTTGAKVILADYKLLQHDFPCLQDDRLEIEYPEIKLLEDDVRELVIKKRIDEWLIRHSCWVSFNQAAQDMVNTPIPVTEDETYVYRPTLYGRACITSIKNNREALGIEPPPGFEDEDGLLDVKGFGLAPGQKHRYWNHGNGLLSLEEAFKEFLNQQLVQAIFRHSGSKMETLPTYAIIQLDFSLRNDLDIMGPAGLLVRRAHRRPENPGGLPVYQTEMQLIQLEAEMLLRHYGVTSCNYITGVRVWKDTEGQFRIKYGDHELQNLTPEQLKNLEEVSRLDDKPLYFEGVNIQHTREFTLDPPHLTLIDFGSFEVREKFKYPILSLVSDRLLHWGGSIWPGFDNYPQPVEGVRVPFDIWGNNTHFWGFEVGLKDSKQNTLCRGVAEHLGSGELNRLDAANILNAFLSTAVAQWVK